MPDAATTTQNISQPKVEEFAISGKLTGTMSDIKSILEKLPFYEIKADGAEIALVKVESRSINKRPFLFHIIRIKPDQIDIIYSLIPDTSTNLRKADVLKNVSAILSMIADKYSIDQSKYLQYIDSILESLISGLSQNYTTIYNRYDSLLSEYRELKRLNIELSASNRNLTIQSAQLTEEKGSFSSMDLISDIVPVSLPLIANSSTFG